MIVESSGGNVYQVELTDAAERDFDKLSPKAKSQVAELIETLANDPYAGNVRKLVGYKGVYRKRTGDYRVIYIVETDVLIVTIVAVGPRKDIYDLMKRRIS